MSGEVTFTLDLEDYTAPGTSPRALETTRRILAFLSERGVRGTFFVVGQFAEEHPGLVKEIAGAGHEIAVHGYRHTPLTEIDPDTFRREVGAARVFLEDVAGRAVTGFRAPAFSLVESTTWAADILPEIGFTYSSSVIPSRNPLYGYPGRPRRPHRWPSGLLELPCPVATVGPITNPYLGGIYLRLLPWWILRHGLSHTDPAEMLWSYCHPYDFDPGEPFQKRPDLGRLPSRLQWVNRRNMFRRVDRLLTRRPAGLPLGERVELLTL
jgi:polysaccharide deacetylase family protein (PEP-CTERM system associated)